MRVRHKYLPWKALIMMVLATGALMNSADAESITVRTGKRNKLKHKKEILHRLLYEDGKHTYVLKKYERKTNDIFYIERYTGPEQVKDQSIEVPITIIGDSYQQVNFGVIGDSMYLFRYASYTGGSKAWLYGSIWSISEGKYTLRDEKIDSIWMKKRHDDPWNYAIKYNYPIISEGSNKLVLEHFEEHHVAEKREVDLLVLDKNLHLVYSTEYHLLYPIYAVEEVRYNCDSKGNILAVVKQILVQEKKNQKHQVGENYYLSYISGLGENRRNYDLDLGKNRMHDLNYRIYPDSDVVLLACILRDGAVDPKDGYLFVKLQLSTLTVINKTKKRFTEADRANFMNAKAIKKKRLMMPFLVRGIVWNRDGSVYVIAECSHIGGKRADEQYQGTYKKRSYRNELMVLSLSQSGKKKWVRMIPKKSIEKLEDRFISTKVFAYRGVHILEMDSGKIALIYGERKKNLMSSNKDFIKDKFKNYIGEKRKGCLVACIVDSAGNVERKVLFENKSNKVVPQMLVAINNSRKLTIVNKSKRRESISVVEVAK